MTPCLAYPPPPQPWRYCPDCLYLLCRAAPDDPIYAPFPPDLDHLLWQDPHDTTGDVLLETEGE